MVVGSYVWRFIEVAPNTREKTKKEIKNSVYEWVFGLDLVHSLLRVVIDFAPKPGPNMLYLPMLRSAKKARVGQRGGRRRKRSRKRRSYQRGGMLLSSMLMGKIPKLPSPKTMQNSLVALKHGSKLIGKAAKFINGNPLKLLPKIGSAINAFQRGGGIGINPRYGDYLERRMGLRPYRRMRRDTVY